MTTYGHLAAGTFTTAISDAENAGAPSGNVYYFEAENVLGNEQFQQSIIPTAGGKVISGKDGKYKPIFRIVNAYVYKKTGDADKTVSFNNILNFLRSLQDAAESPGYLWAYNQVNSDYLSLGRFSATPTDYCKGYIGNLQWKWEKVQYVFTTLQWEGVSN